MERLLLRAVKEPVPEMRNRVSPMTTLERIWVRAPGTMIGVDPSNIAFPIAWLPLPLQHLPYVFPWRPHGHGFSAGNGGISGFFRFSLDTSSGVRSFMPIWNGCPSGAGLLQTRQVSGATVLRTPSATPPGLCREAFAINVSMLRLPQSGQSKTTSALNQ